jgi:hypothetical protein
VAACSPPDLRGLRQDAAGVVVAAVVVAEPYVAARETEERLQVTYESPLSRTSSEVRTHRSPAGATMLHSATRSAAYKFVLKFLTEQQKDKRETPGLETLVCCDISECET